MQPSFLRGMRQDIHKKEYKKRNRINSFFKRSYSCGSPLVPSLQVVYTIISQVCFLKEIMAHLFLRYVVSILEVR